MNGQLTHTTGAVGATPAAPTAASPVLATGAGLGQGGIVMPFRVKGRHTPGADRSLRVCLSIWAPTSGTVTTYGTAAWPVDLVIIDRGVDPGAAQTLY